MWKEVLGDYTMKIYACVLSAVLACAAFAADSTSTPAVTSVPAKHVKSMTAMGSVSSTDLVGNTITVEGKKKAQWTFEVPATAKLTQGKGKKAIALGDINSGDKVAVKYTKDGDTLTASSIKVWPAKKAAPADSSKK